MRGTMENKIEVKVGQVWEDWDIRHRDAPGRRRIKVIEIKDGKVIKEERMLQGLNERIRDVRQGPDGALYLLTDNSAGRILRVAPAK